MILTQLPPPETVLILPPSVTCYHLLPATHYNLIIGLFSSNFQNPFFSGGDHDHGRSAIWDPCQ